MKLEFGRHKGKTIAQILEEAPHYVVWLADHHHSPTIKELARNALGLKAPPQPITAPHKEILRRFHALLPGDTAALHTLKQVLAEIQRASYDPSAGTVVVDFTKSQSL